MYICQKSLINHLRFGFSPTEIPTIEAYAGQLSVEKESAIDITAPLPAVFVSFIDGRPMAELDAKYHQMGLIVVTQNDTSTLLESHQSNLVLVSDVAEYLKDKFTFTASGGRGSYSIRKPDTTAMMILNNSRYCVIGLTLYISDLRR